MVSSAQKIRLGLFIVVSSALFLIMLIAVAANQFFQDKDIYYISYQNISVNGLDKGSSVKYLGIKIGTVQNIKIDPNDITRVIITIGVDPGTPIKKDVHADISTIGITGIKLIELFGGTNEAETIPPGSYIQPGKSLTEEITGKAEIIGEKIEILLNDLIKMSKSINPDDISNLVEQSSQAATVLNTLLTKNRNQINHSLREVDNIAVNLRETTNSSKIIFQEIEHILASDTIQAAIGNISKISHTLNKANIYGLINGLAEATFKLNNILDEMDKIVIAKEQNIENIINQLETTVESLNSAAKKIDEDPSILLNGSRPDNPPDDNLE